jgi:mono/diheme cytochrome c family protein
MTRPPSVPSAPDQDAGSRRPMLRAGKVVAVALLAVAATAGTGVALYRLAVDGTGWLTTTELERGSSVYRERCASCHGVNLEGQPRWKELLPSGRLPAPPHDASGHTWHHPDGMLFQITRNGPATVVGGGYESDMPAFKDVLSDDEIRAVLTFIKSRWPRREREYQEMLSRREWEAHR